LDLLFFFKDGFKSLPLLDFLLTNFFLPLEVDLDLVEVSLDFTFLALFDLDRVPTFFFLDLLLLLLLSCLFLDPLGVVLCESIAKDVEEREGLMVLAVP